MDRRSLLKAAGSLAGLAVAGAAIGAEKCGGKLQFKNSDFLGADGKFDPEKAKDGLVRFCRYHGYPVFQLGEPVGHRLRVGPVRRAGPGGLCVH
jgi:hypothetical protein